MDFKKILAGMSALAIASTVAVAAFADGGDVAGTTSSATDSNVDAVKGTKSNLYTYKATEKVAEYTVPAAKVVKDAKVVVKVSGDATKVTFGDKEVAVANGEATYTATAAADLAVKADKGAIESIDVVTKDTNSDSVVRKAIFDKDVAGGTATVPVAAATLGASDLTEGSKLVIKTVGATDTVALQTTSAIAGTIYTATAKDGVAEIVIGNATTDSDKIDALEAGFNVVATTGAIKSVEFVKFTAGTLGEAVSQANKTLADVNITHDGASSGVDFTKLSTKKEEQKILKGDKIVLTTEKVEGANAQTVTFANGDGLANTIKNGTYTVDNNKVTYEYKEVADEPKTIKAEGCKIAKIEVVRKVNNADVTTEIYTAHPTTLTLAAGATNADKGNFIVVATNGKGTVSVVSDDADKTVIGSAEIVADKDKQGKELTTGTATIEIKDDAKILQSLKNFTSTVKAEGGATLTNVKIKTADAYATGDAITKVFTYAGETTVKAEATNSLVANLAKGDKILVTKGEAGKYSIGSKTEAPADIVVKTSFAANSSTAIYDVDTDEKVATLKKGFVVAGWDGTTDTTAKTIAKVEIETTAAKENTENVYEYTTEAAPTSKSIFGSAVTDVKKGDQIVVTTEKGAKVTVAGKAVTADDNGVATLTVNDENLSGGFEVTSDKGITAIDKVVFPVVVEESSASEATPDSSSEATPDTSTSTPDSTAETVTTPVYEGSLETGDWANAIEVKKTTIDPATLKVGDKIVVSATVTDAAAVTADKPAKITVQDAKWGDIADFGYPEVTADKAEYVFDVTEAALTQLKTSAAEAENAFVVKGTNATITKVAVVTAKEDAPAAEKVTPAKVTGGKEKSASGTAIRLSWNEAKDATGYIIYKYDAKAKKYVRVGKTAKTEYVVKKLASGTQYKFAVKSFHRNDDKSISYAAAQTGIVGYTKVYAPSALTVKNSAKGKATVSFTKSKTSGVKYKIMYKTTAKGKYKTLKKTALNKYTFKATKNKTYYIQVQGYKTIGKKVLYSAAVKKAVKITK